MTKAKKDKGWKNDLQNTAQKTNEWATLTPLQNKCELMRSVGGKQFLLQEVDHVVLLN